MQDLEKELPLKGLYGKQRFNFDNGFQNGDGIVRGVDVEFELNQLFDSAMTNFPGQLTIGGSYVSKYERNRSNTYDFPENVGSGGIRVNYVQGGFQFNGEYARTSKNPSALNSQIVDIPDSLRPTSGFISNIGQGVKINATYSQQGLGVVAYCEFHCQYGLSESKKLWAL